MTNSENQQRNAIVDNYLFALQQRNLVYNYDFRYFSNRVVNGSITNYGIPDGWEYTDDGTNGSIDFDAASHQLVIKKSGGSETMTFSQALQEFPRWQQMLLNENIAVKVSLNIGLAGPVNITLTDGVSSVTATRSTKGDTEVELRLSVNKAAESLHIKIETAVPFMTIKLNYVCANVGQIALKNLPCIVQGIIGERRQYVATETPPAEELSLCNTPIELSNNYSRLNSVLNKRFGAGANGNSLLLDMRGYFSRAWDNGAGTDPDAGTRSAPGKGTITGDHVSTFEQDVFLKHDHGLNFSIDKPYAAGPSGTSFNVVDPTGTSDTTKENEGKETRPVNIAELYTIKWA